MVFFYANKTKLKELKKVTIINFTLILKNVIIKYNLMRVFIMNDFQERLKELLVENNLSRLQLSKILNISSTTINGYFNNNYYPKIEIAISMSIYFNCSLDFLFGLSDIKNNASHNNTFFENFNNLIKLSGISIAQTMKNLK